MAGLLGVFASGAVADEQPAKKGKFSGEYEDYLIAYRKPTKYAITERAARLKLANSFDRLDGSVSYLTSPQFHGQQLHESYLGYNANGVTVRTGPQMIPIGQSTWDDQWYDPSNFLPSSEYWQLIKGLSLSAVVPSVWAQSSNGPQQLTVSTFGIGKYLDKFTPDRLSVIAARYQYFVENTILGISSAQDFVHSGDNASLYCIDFRHTIPHLVTRGEMIWSHRNTDRTTTGFATATYRPEHWSDASLFVRYQFLNPQFGPKDSREVLGAKLRAPFDFTVNINYVLAPHMGKLRSGAGWSFELYRVYRF